MSENEYIQLPLDFEIWKPIPGYEGLYEVSNHGRIKRLANTSPQGSKEMNREHTIKPWLQTNGYLAAYLCKKGANKAVRVHRVVARTFFGQCPEGCVVNHKDGSKSNNRSDNLEYITRQANQLHSYRVLGRQSPNQNGGRPHLKESQVLEIRKLLETVSVGELAKKFGVSYMTIHGIKQGRIWKHVK